MVRTIFGNRMLFLLIPGGFSYLTNLNNSNSNWKKLLGFRNIQEKLENKVFPNLNLQKIVLAQNGLLLMKKNEKNFIGFSCKKLYSKVQFWLFSMLIFGQKSH
jgi:hypothetical protein